MTKKGVYFFWNRLNTYSLIYTIIVRVSIMTDVEPWEETLREELIKKDSPAKDKTEREELEERIREKLKEKYTPAPLPQTKPIWEPSGWKIFLLLCLVVCLAVIIIYAAGKKKYGFNRFLDGLKPNVQVLEQHQPAQRPEPIPDQIAPRTVDRIELQQIVILKAELRKIKLTAEEANTRSIKNHAKIQVAGVVINENAVINKHEYSPKDIMTIGRNWRLQRFPKYLILTDADRDFLSNLRGSLGDESLPTPSESQVNHWQGNDDEALLLAESNAEKIRMLGIIVHENAVIQRWNLDRKETMLITSGWKFPKFPKFSTLRDVDKEFIRINLKPASSANYAEASK